MIQFWKSVRSIEEYEVNKLKNEDGYSCFYAFVQLPGRSISIVLGFHSCLWNLVQASNASVSLSHICSCWKQSVCKQAFVQ